MTYRMNIHDDMHNELPKTIILPSEEKIDYLLSIMPTDKIEEKIILTQDINTYTKMCDELKLRKNILKELQL
jgi:hypothetical protein